MEKVIEISQVDYTGKLQCALNCPLNSFSTCIMGFHEIQHTPAGPMMIPINCPGTGKYRMTLEKIELPQKDDSDCDDDIDCLDPAEHRPESSTLEIPPGTKVRLRDE